MRELKPATTIEQQLKLLESKGVIIENRERASEILLSVNYYNLSGYLFKFRKNDGKYNNVSFHKVCNIFECDKRLKSLLLYVIEDIEHNIKTKIAYFMAHDNGPLGYTEPKNFINVQEHTHAITLLKRHINLNKKIPFVAHHITNYGSRFPIWVAIELFTFGMVWKFYKNLKTPLRKAIAQYFNTGANQLESWMECVSYVRNLSAHNMRLYNYNLSKTPKFCKRNFKNYHPTHGIYDTVYIMKFLFSNKDEWNNYILPTLNAIFEQYSDFINLESYGFPINYTDALYLT